MHTYALYCPWRTTSSWRSSKVNLRPTIRRPSGTRDQFFFLHEISFRQLRLCYFVAPFLTRGRVCNLLVQLLLGLARAVTLGSKSHRTHGHILLSHVRLPPSWRARFSYLYPRGTGWPSYTPGHWVPFLSPLTTRRDYGGSILTRLHTGPQHNWRERPIYLKTANGHEIKLNCLGLCDWYKQIWRNMT
jgi:hypothetical protein